MEEKRLSMVKLKRLHSRRLSIDGLGETWKEKFIITQTNYPIGAVGSSIMRKRHGKALDNKV